jgi:hypothetical protein
VLIEFLNVYIDVVLIIFEIDEYFIFQLTGRKNRVIPAVCVVLLSATFHEYVMIFALGFFYPVMFVLFGVVGSRLIRKSFKRFIHLLFSALSIFITTK